MTLRKSFPAKDFSTFWKKQIARSAKKVRILIKVKSNATLWTYKLKTANGTINNYVPDLQLSQTINVVKNITIILTKQLVISFVIYSFVEIDFLGFLFLPIRYYQPFFTKTLQNSISMKVYLNKTK